MKSKTLFTEVLGENSTIKVIDFLVENRELDFGVGDIARETKLSRQTVYDVIERLIEKKIVNRTRHLQNKQLYALNEESKIARKLKELFDTVLLAR